MRRHRPPSVAHRTGRAEIYRRVGAEEDSVVQAARGYANGLLAQLRHAEVDLAHFHAVRLTNAAVDDVRRRVQQEVLGYRGRKGDPL